MYLTETECIVNSVGHQGNLKILEDSVTQLPRKIGAAPGREPGVPPHPDTGTPRWVIVFGLIAAALFLVFVTVHVAGGGMHHHGASFLRAATAQPPGGQP